MDSCGPARCAIVATRETRRRRPPLGDVAIPSLPPSSPIARAESAFEAASPALRWLPALLCYGLIAWLSHSPGMGAQTTASWLDRIALADWNTLVRMLAHVLVYAVLGFWLHAALAGRIGFVAAKAWPSLALGALLGGLDEWHQSFVPGRAGRLSDALTDVLGVALGLALIWWYGRWRAGRRAVADRAALATSETPLTTSSAKDGIESTSDSEPTAAAVSATAAAHSGGPARWSEDARGLMALFVLTAIWGTTFAVIKNAVGEMLPGSLILARFALAALVLTPFFWARARHASVWRAGLELGFLIWLGYTTQAIGLTHTTASRSGFITALSVVLVPALAALTGRRIAWLVWLAALLALFGVALLSWDGSPPNRGDAWTLVTALAYALFVLRLEAHARSQSTAGLTLTQLWGVIPFALLWALWEAGGTGAGTAFDALAEHWRSVSAASWWSVVYLAIVATALTTALQTYGQRRVSAPSAALIYTLEPVFAAGVAAILLGERLGPQGMVGAGLILVASLLGQRDEVQDGSRVSR